MIASPIYRRILAVVAVLAACGPRDVAVEMPEGVPGPDVVLVGEWMPQDVEWTVQPSWIADPRQTASTTVVSFGPRGELRIASGRYYLSDSIAFGDDPERRGYLGRWRWLDSTRAELRYRLVHDDMPIRGEQIPGGVVIDTIRAVDGRVLDFEYTRGSGGEWKGAFERAPTLSAQARATIRGMGSEPRKEWDG